MPPLESEQALPAKSTYDKFELQQGADYLLFVLMKEEQRVG